MIDVKKAIRISNTESKILDNWENYFYLALQKESIKFTLKLFLLIYLSIVN